MLNECTYIYANFDYCFDEESFNFHLPFFPVQHNQQHSMPNMDFNDIAVKAINLDLKFGFKYFYPLLLYAVSTTNKFQKP